MKTSRRGRQTDTHRISRRALFGTLLGVGGILAVGPVATAITRWGSAGSSQEPATAFPAWVRTSPYSLQAYRAAYANLDLMDTLPCFCGCDSLDRSHASLKYCFIQPNGQIERHGSVCGTCQGEAIDAAGWAEGGIPVPEIYDRIVARYSNGMPVPQRPRPS